MNPKSDDDWWQPVVEAEAVTLPEHGDDSEGPGPNLDEIAVVEVDDEIVDEGDEDEDPGEVEG